MCSDPPREKAENLGPEQDFVPLAELVAQADIVTLHTPLVRTGHWPTYHLVDSNFVAMMKPGATLLNASRGEVADTAALIGHETEKLALYIDVWEGEPHHLNPTLLSRAEVATTHIAGYSLQGKANASAIVVRALAKHFGIEQLADWYPSGVTPSAPRPISWAEMSAQIDHYCPLEAETEWLRSHPTEFDQHRNTYPLREEFF